MRSILVVDDEPLVALMIRRTLEPACKVEIRHSGRSALKLFQEGQRFDAVLTDVKMPDGDGFWLHRELTRLDPAQARRMIFLSGAPGEVPGQPGARLLQKPFRAAELIALVEAAAGGRASDP